MTEKRGGPARRWSAVLLVGLISLIGTVGQSSSAFASTDDFSFESMSVDYELSRSPSGKSVLTTHESLVAIFPDFDQNHGIRRAIPLTYDGVSTDPTVVSVMDANGRDLPYTTEESDGYLLVTVRDENFVHGRVEYVISYTQHNVILVPDNAVAVQEFYWDVNGMGWAQPFGVVSATVTISPDLVSAVTGESACYRGAQDETTACEQSEPASTPDGGRVFRFTADNVAPYETLTFALGFARDTFFVPDTSLWAHPLGIVFAVLTGIMMMILGCAIVLRATLWRNAPGRGIIIAQYDAPEAITPVLAGNIVRRPTRAIVAALLRLAVRGNIVIRDESSAKKRGSDFVLEVVSVRDLGDEDRLVMQATFGSSPAVGSTITTSTPDTVRARRLRQVWQATKLNAVGFGFRSRPHARLRRALIAVALATGVAVFFVGGAIIVDGYGGAAEVLITYFATFVVTVASCAILGTVAPLTVQGALAREHLLGLKLFIRLAEADRIAFLQTPAGAQRRPDPTKAGEYIHLYEKVLPYAVLFGLESRWAAELSVLYEKESMTPTWFGSSDAFVASTFAASVSALASSASTWAASSSSSSLSGSSGGGSAGGGGGGGGGGGV